MPTSFYETKTYDRLVSSTFENNVDDIQNQINKATALLAFMRENGRIKIETGGERISVPIMYGKNTTIQSQAKQTPINTTPMDGITKVFYNWKVITGSITIWDVDLMLNKGNKVKQFDIMDAAREQFILSVAETVTGQLMGDGTGNGSLDLLGIQAIIADTPTSGTLAGIDRSTNPYWRNQYNNAVGAFASAGLNKTRNLYNKCALGSTKGTPDLCMMTQTIYESFENEHLLVLRLAKEDEKMADLKFANFKFGTATCVFDEQSPSGSQYMINTKYMYLVVHEDGNFQIMPKRSTYNQLATIIPFLLLGNMITSNPRKLGVNTGIT